MNEATAERLLELNRRFYEERGGEFSETRRRVQPGVGRLLWTLRGGERVLDLGCGNGQLARELARLGHRGEYMGVDLSSRLLQEARASSLPFRARFIQADLAWIAPRHDAACSTTPETRVADSDSLARLGSSGGWAVVAAFAVLHHIPGNRLRTALLRRVRTWLGRDCMFMHSHWQFAARAQREGRLQPWAEIELTPGDVDAADFLLDWRRGGRSLRYVHEFSEDELRQLADETGFVVAESFRSDGRDRQSGLYQVWRPR